MPADLTDFRSGSYQTTDPDDRVWAAAEMWETTGDPVALADFEDRLRAGGFGENLVRADFDWPDLANLGMYTCLLSTREGRDPALVDQIASELIDVADLLTSNSNATGYGRALTGWYWSSNGSVARACMLLHVARRLTGSDEYLGACAAQIAHLYGRNHYGRSQVTGEGVAPPCHPHHRPSGSDEEQRPYPGLLVGGGESPTDWRDEQSNYRTNEVAINWNAALVYALAGFVRGTGADVSAAADWMDEGYTCPVQPVMRSVFNPDTSGPPSLIDDLEDGDLEIIETEGWRGSWFDFDDGTGENSGSLVESPGRDGSGLALHISGSGFTAWGGGVGLRLNTSDETRATYDASRYSGITFWARVGDGSGTRFFVMVPDRNCSNCYDHFHAPLMLTPDWQQFTSSWHELRQQGFGDTEPNVTDPEGGVDRAHLYDIQFQWDDGQTFDLWVDDVAFTTSGSPAGEAGAGGSAGAGRVAHPRAAGLERCSDLRSSSAPKSKVAERTGRASGPPLSARTTDHPPRTIHLRGPARSLGRRHQVRMHDCRTRSPVAAFRASHLGGALLVGRGPASIPEDYRKSCSSRGRVRSREPSPGWGSRDQHWDRARWTTGEAAWTTDA